MATPGFTHLHGLAHEQLPAALGQAASASSVSVVIASDQSALPVTATVVPATRVKSNAPTTIDYTSGGGVTTAAYTQLVASLTTTTTRIYVQDTSGSFMILAFGAALSEVDQLYFGPGFADFVDINIPSGTRVSLKALDVNATTGRVVFSFFT